ncbi:MAG: DUF418 domain-containing protein [Candidatus Aminicenantes bacterium]|jgi:uncharacterized protein
MLNQISQQDSLSPVGPTTIKDRILSLDVLRGIAILGILIMNIQGYSMIQAAYLNPAAYGDLSGINKWVWILSHIFADQKFMTIFSIMYGAGIVLLTSRAAASKRSVAGLHFRRTFWLLIIGLIHAYLMWHGDILVPYALCAIPAFLFRKLKPKTLVIFGMILILIASLIYLAFGLSMPQWPIEAKDNVMSFWNPNAEATNSEIEAYRGGWTEQMTHRVPSSIAFHTFVFLIWTGWRVGGLMLIGMALFKWGILSAERSKRLYQRLITIGLPVGWTLVIMGIIQNFSHGWSLEYSMYLGWQFNYWGSLFVSMAYIGIIMLICLSNTKTKLLQSFAAVGRMALSNYLLQTVICTTIFYGHGLGFFGRLDRWQQILIIPAIWIFQLIVSPIWLRHFRFGPVEWLWRSLTYLKLQPFRIQKSINGDGPQ